MSKTKRKAATDTAATDQPETPLTEKQKRFVQEYLVDLNGTQAAIRAGYSAKTANEIAAENLTKPNIQAALEPLIADRAAKVGIKAENVVIGLAQLATANMQDFETVLYDGDLKSLTREQAAAIQEMTVETYTEGKGDEAREVKRVRLKLAPKIPALESLGKHLGMYIERKAIAIGHFGDATDEQLDSVISELAAEIGVGTGAAGKEKTARH